MAVKVSSRVLVQGDGGVTERFIDAFSAPFKGGYNVGFQGETMRAPGDDASVPQYAYYNEFGLGVPERSFMRVPFDENRFGYEALMGELLENVKTDAELMRATLRVANEYYTDVVEAITSNIPPPNSQETIERKGSSRTLIDTGRMRQSVRVMQMPTAAAPTLGTILTGSQGTFVEPASVDEG